METSTVAVVSGRIAPVEPGKLTASERAVWDAFPRGERVELARVRGGRGRAVRAEVVAALLLGAVPQVPGRVAGLWVEGAVITGALDLAHATVTAPVRLRRCEFDTVVDLSGAKTRLTDFEGAALAGLVAPLSEVDGDLSIAECSCTGPVVLTGARIRGALSMSGSRLERPGDVALSGERMTIDGDLIALGASVDGGFRLGSARVEGSVLLDGASLSNDGGEALSCSNITIGARFLARNGFTSGGSVRLNHADIGGDLRFDGGTINNPGDKALIAWGVRAGGTIWLGDGFTCRGAVRLSGARTSAEIYLAGATLVNPGGAAVRCRTSRVGRLVLTPGLMADGQIVARIRRPANVQFAGKVEGSLLGAFVAFDEPAAPALPQVAGNSGIDASQRSALLLFRMPE